jgi:predicted nucleotidyltransferase
MDSEPSRLPQNLQTGLRQIADVLNSSNIRYALIGGIAVGFRSQPRFTKDIDLLLEISQVKLPGLLDDLHDRGFAFETAKTIQEWTKDHLAVIDFHGVRIDWLKPVIPLYKHVIDTSKTETWLGCSVAIASPECLILTKLIAFRTQDQVDIENLLAANQGQLDVPFIRSEWETIASESDPRMQRFLEMAAKFYGPIPEQG